MKSSKTGFFVVLSSIALCTLVVAAPGMAQADDSGGLIQELHPGQYDSATANKHWQAAQAYQKQGNNQYAIAEYGKVADVVIKAGKKNMFAKNLAESVLTNLQVLEGKCFMTGQMQQAGQATTQKLRLIEMLHGKESNEYKQAEGAQKSYQGLEKGANAQR